MGSQRVGHDWGTSLPLGHHRALGTVLCAIQSVLIRWKVKVELAQLCPTDSLWPHGSPGQNTGVDSHPFSMGSSQPRSPTLPVDSLPAEPQGKPKNTGVGRLSFLQGMFPTQESNRDLLLYRWLLYQLSYWEAPRLPPQFSLVFYFIYSGVCIQGFPGGPVVKNPPANAGDARDMDLIPWVRKILQRKK